MKPKCEWCGSPVDTDVSLATSQQPTVYCSEDCECAEKYHNRRNFEETLWWEHPCPNCERPMFTPPKKDGWWCPECGIEEPIDKTGYRYVQEENIGFVGVNGSLERPCPNCDSWIWTHDGAMMCHSCDVYFNQYGRVWWAMIEQEYPPKYTSWNAKDETEQTELIE